jgi:hypothetical protein
MGAWLNLHDGSFAVSRIACAEGARHTRRHSAGADFSELKQSSQVGATETKIPAAIARYAGTMMRSINKRFQTTLRAIRPGHLS